MKSAYDEIMSRIEVSDEMKKRILSKLQEVEAQPKRNFKTVRFPALRKYLTAAACLALLLTGVFTLPQLWGSEPPDSDYITAAPNMSQAASAEELSELVGFDVADIPELPFEIDEAAYTAYGTQLAEITYQGGGQTATFRKSAGSEDNSGDYNVYTRTEKVPVGGVTATLKGDEGAYILAIWSDGTYSYSLRIPGGLAVERWSEILSSIMR